MVAQARRRNAQAVQQGRVAVHPGSATSLPFTDARFDRALAVNSLHHWPDAAQSLRELRRVLKPGGVLVIAEQPVWAGKDADDCQIGRDLATQIAAAGFAPVAVHTRRMWQTPTIGVRAIRPGDQAATPNIA
jgi:ubiquinone/menaquinone biosynthesis C-methylase UbiE